MSPRGVFVPLCLGFWDHRGVSREWGGMGRGQWWAHHLHLDTHCGRSTLAMFLFATLIEATRNMARVEPLLSELPVRVLNKILGLGWAGDRGCYQTIAYLPKLAIELMGTRDPS